MSIHPTALVDSDAEIGAGVTIGPYCIIEGGTRIGDNCELGSHVVIHRHTTLGPDNKVDVGAVLGGAPQDLKYHDEPTYAVIGARNYIREYVTVHRATGEGETTVVGDDNFLMAYVHIAHNCRVGNSVMMASYVGLSGFATIEDYVVIGGLAGVHQFTTVGTMAMIAAMSRHSRDVPPYVIVEGSPARVRSLNIVGMRRRGVSPESISSLRAAYRYLFAPESEFNATDAIERVRQEVPMTPELEHLLSFLARIDQGSRGRQEG